jgi:hypothetical protein
MGELEDFVDFQSAKARRQAALDHLLAVAPALEAAGAPSITEAEIQADVDAIRGDLDAEVPNFAILFS